MFNFFKNLFLSDKQKISKLISSTERVVSVKKEPFYHEIVGNTVRIYSRTNGLVEEVHSFTPIKTAIELLKVYNGVNK